MLLLKLRDLIRHTLAGLAKPDQVLTLGPHDALVLNYTRTLSADEADRIKGRIRADLPGITVLLVCADRASVQTAVRG